MRAPSVQPVVVTLPDEAIVVELGEPPAGVVLRPWDLTAPAAAALGEEASRVRAVVLPSRFSRAASLGLLAGLPDLRLVQAMSAGVEDLVGRLPDGVLLANGAGVHEASTAELAIGLVLASLRGLQEALHDQVLARWNHRRHLSSLADRRVLLLGVGGVGTAVAARLRPFQVDLVRVASRARADGEGMVHSVDELPRLLPTADVVIITLPLTADTRRLVDEAFLAAMPDQSLLVNVGRGAVVDTDALMGELRSGRLRAALDVAEPEPLPSEHPLWGLPGVIITPHLGGFTTAMHPRAVSLLRSQLQRIAVGTEPANLVPAREAQAVRSTRCDDSTHHTDEG